MGTIEDYNIEEIAEGAIILDGLDDAIVGVVEEFGNGRRVLYSTDKIIDLLMERDGMTDEEAIEFFEFNIIGSYNGEGMPIFVTPYDAYDLPD